MKVIALWNNYNNGTEKELPAADIALCWLSDSCLLREGRPFYIPDFDDDFRLFPTLAIKIGRLGKSITERFAHRYWSEVSVWINARATGELARLQSKGLPIAGAVAFDNSLIAAPFFSLDARQTASASFSVYRNGEKVCDWQGNCLRLSPEQAISRTSICNTLKTGDIILLGFPVDNGISVAPGDNMEIRWESPDTGSIRRGQVLNSFKIK